MIRKPSNDTRKYKRLVLNNKLEVIIVYDKDADISAASLSVGVGYYMDPPDCLGLAHFLEHMLFMGTKKYPSTKYFMEFVNNHGGMTNAHTAHEFTTYFYNIQSKNFEKSLDIFAQFFIDPLLNGKNINKEMNAVDSEHSKNLNKDIWRVDRIIQMVSRNDHPYHKFSTGTLETLNCKNIKQKLVDFFNKYYSSNVMKLVVCSNISISRLETIIRKVFGKIKNRNYIPKKYNGKPFDFSDSIDNSECYKLIKMVPIANVDNVYIFWQLPPLKKYFMKKPLDYISSLLGHESKGSLIQYLRDSGLALSINVGSYDEDISMSLFFVNIELTKKGFQHIPEIISLVYEYIDQIKNIGIEEWRFNENKDIAGIFFKYLPKKEQTELVLHMSENLLYYPYENVLSVPYDYEKYSKDTYKLINRCLSDFDKKKSIVLISSKKYNDLAIKNEKYYGIKYIYKKYPNKLGDEFKYNNILHINNLHLPIKNTFIPSNISILPTEDDNIDNQPIRINTIHDNIEIWFKKDNKFKLPKVLVKIKLYNHKISDNLRNRALFNLYINIINYTNLSDSYYAILAGTDFKIVSDMETVEIHLFTYYQKVKKILKLIVNSVINPKFDQNIFNFVKMAYHKELENFIYDSPVALGLEYLKEKSFKVFYSNEEILKIINDIEYVDVKKVRDMIINSSKMKCFIGGNIHKKDATNLVNILSKLTPKKSIKSGMPIVKMDLLQPGQIDEYIRDAYNPEEPDSAIILFYEIEFLRSDTTKNWDKLFGMLLMTNILTEERFFHELRSIQQSGYIVKSFIINLGGLYNSVRGLSFLIQSSKKSLEELEKNIKLFIKNSFKFIKNLNDTDFENTKKTVITLLNRNDNSMIDEFNRYFSQIFTGEYMFDKNKIVSVAVEQITKKDLENFFNRYFIDTNTKKMRVVKIRAR